MYNISDMKIDEIFFLPAIPTPLKINAADIIVSSKIHKVFFSIYSRLLRSISALIPVSYRFSLPSFQIPTVFLYPHSRFLSPFLQEIEVVLPSSGSRSTNNFSLMARQAETDLSYVNITSFHFSVKANLNRFLFNCISLDTNILYYMFVVRRMSFDSTLQFNKKNFHEYDIFRLQ